MRKYNIKTIAVKIQSWPHESSDKIYNNTSGESGDPLKVSISKVTCCQ